MINHRGIIILTLVLLAALAIGLDIGVATSQSEAQIDINTYALEKGATPIEEQLAKTETVSTALYNGTGAFKASVDEAQAKDEQLSTELADLAKKAANNKNLSIEAYEKIIVSRLGKAIYTHNGDNSQIMIFELEKEDLRGYMAKIRLKNSSALRVTINPDDKPKGETTSAAAKRMDAIFAVNGGGFAKHTTEDGVVHLVPLGNAMVKGKLVGDFIPSVSDLAFAGFSKTNKLVGGVYDKEEDLLNSGAWQGVSFVPALVSDWEPLTIPSKWASAKQPRTVLGQYPNGDIFFIVVDGRQSNWSNGITLEEMQVLLLHLGVMEAFNLDGGGSSTMYYNGEVLNKPSDGSERALATNIVVMP